MNFHALLQQLVSDNFLWNIHNGIKRHVQKYTLCLLFNCTFTNDNIFNFRWLIFSFLQRIFNTRSCIILVSLSKKYFTPGDWYFHINTYVYSLLRQNLVIHLHISTLIQSSDKHSFLKSKMVGKCTVIKISCKKCWRMKNKEISRIC